MRVSQIDTIAGFYGAILLLALTMIGQGARELGNSHVLRVVMQALEMRRRMLGPDHALTMATLNNLAIVYRKQGLYARAEPLYERAMTSRDRALGQGHPLFAETVIGRVGTSSAYTAGTPRNMSCSTEKPTRSRTQTHIPARSSG